MEFLVFLLILIFVVVSEGKGKKKKGAPPGAQAPAPGDGSEMMNKLYAKATSKLEAALSGEPTQETPVPSMNAHRKRGKIRASAARPAAAPVAVPIPVPVSATEGISHDDDEGCLGGSLEHTHTEGESHEEHQRHVEALRRREAEESLAAQAAVDTANMNLRRLRQAVVMAEILDRPVSLRRARR